MSSQSKKHKYTSADADGALRRFFTVRQYVYHMSNKYLFENIHGGWESDFITMIKKSQYFSEVEIKVAKADFYKDFEKPKHKILEQIYTKGWALEGRTLEFWKESNEELRKDMQRGVTPHSYVRFHMPENLVLPHRFYFCYPEDLIPTKDVPPYAGILIVRQAYIRYNLVGASIKEIRKAPLLHKQPILEKVKDKLLEKFFYESFNSRTKQDYQRLRELNKKDNQTT